MIICDSDFLCVFHDIMIARSSYSAESGKERDMCRILIIEDDREMNQGISYVLEKDGYRTLPSILLQKGRMPLKSRERI